MGNCHPSKTNVDRDDSQYLYKAFSVLIEGRVQCYASLHSDFHEYLEVTMQVKRAIEKALLHKLPMCIQRMQSCTCTCVESPDYMHVHTVNVGSAHIGTCA